MKYFITITIILSIIAYSCNSTPNNISKQSVMTGPLMLSASESADECIIDRMNEDSLISNVYSSFDELIDHLSVIRNSMEMSTYNLYSCDLIQNAEADYDDNGVPSVFFNPKLFDDVSNSDTNIFYGLLGHEIAHLVLDHHNDDSSENSKKKMFELQADYFSGALFASYVPTDISSLASSYLGLFSSLAPSAVYPELVDRIALVEDAFREYKSNRLSDSVFQSQELLQILGLGNGHSVIFNVTDEDLSQEDLLDLIKRYNSIIEPIDEPTNLPNISPGVIRPNNDRDEIIKEFSKKSKMSEEEIRNMVNQRKKNE